MDFLKNILCYSKYFLVYFLGKFLNFCDYLFVNSKIAYFRIKEF